MKESRRNRIIELLSQNKSDKEILSVLDQEFSDIEYKTSHQQALYGTKRDNTEKSSGMEQSDIIEQAIFSYKEHLRETQLKDEVYKWKAIKHFQDEWNPESEDFGAMFLDLIKGHRNLMNHRSQMMLKYYCNTHSEVFKKAILDLYNEGVPIETRIINYQEEVIRLTKIGGDDWKDFQDERAISVYLTFKYPDTYIHYKNSFYSFYCRSIGVSKAKTGQKFIHYQEIANDLKENYLKEDQELISLYKSILTEEEYLDPNLNLLTQDFLFFFENRYSEKNSVNYWIFQGNPLRFDFEKALNDGVLKDFTVTTHKKEIKIGDKVILWLTGNQAGCYGLAEVSSEPHETGLSPDDHLWKGDAKEGLKANIDITHNLIDSPIFKQQIEEIKEFQNLKVGNQGSNFSATKEEYEKLLQLIDNMNKTSNYWIMGAGEQAKYWPGFLKEKIISIGMGPLGDIRDFKSKDEIEKAFQKAEGHNNKRTMDTLAGWEFCNTMKTGDVVFVKRGISEYVGYGKVSSQYQFDPEREYKNIRSINWIKTGSWVEDFGQIPIKTLTRITDKKSQDKRYIKDYERILALIKGDSSKKTSGVSLNQIFYGPPGTGKTYNTINEALKILNPDFDFDQDRQRVKSEFSHFVKSGQAVFTSFHQSMNYEDFIEGIKPQEPKKEGDPISFKVEDGIFKQICSKANPSFGNIVNVIEKFKKEISEDDDKEPITITAKGTVFSVIYRGTGVFYVQPHASSKEKPWYPVNINNIKQAYETGSYEGIYNQTYVREIINFLERERGLRKGSSTDLDIKSYVIIIDEINRGNIAQIFGELITLIEEDKRLGKAEALEVTLPYSKTRFGVPSNLHIIGTMNTADRSVEALDSALRRRFTFKEFMPNLGILKTVLGKQEEWKDISLTEVLGRINQRIDTLLDRDHQIGHSYFLSLKNSDSFEKELKKVFTQKIIPLLQEYFYNDYVKIGMVLGGGFVLAVEKASDLFANIDGGLDSEYDDNKVYELIPESKIDLLSALKSLLNLTEDEQQ
jgi:hypothetical protein